MNNDVCMFLDTLYHLMKDAILSRPLGVTMLNVVFEVLYGNLENFGRRCDIMILTFYH